MRWIFSLSRTSKFCLFPCASYYNTRVCGAVGSALDWRSKGPVFDPRRAQEYIVYPASWKCVDHFCEIPFVNHANSALSLCSQSINQILLSTLFCTAHSYPPGQFVIVSSPHNTRGVAVALQPSKLPARVRFPACVPCGTTLCRARMRKTRTQHFPRINFGTMIFLKQLAQNSCWALTIGRAWFTHPSGKNTLTSLCCLFTTCRTDYYWIPHTIGLCK